MKRSEEILKIVKLKTQALGMLVVVPEERFEKFLQDFQSLAFELKEINDGATADETIRSAVTIAKITAPGTSEVLHRDRLYRMLDECGKTPVTWTTGPPGSGKTTLIAGYLDRRSLPRLWYRFDDGDADPATFFSYLGQAVKQAAPRSRRPLPLLTPEYAFGGPAFTRRYFEQVYQRCRPPVVLVFDNYQDVPRESPVQDVMQKAFSAAPPGTRIFVISRDAPPPAFSRLLAGGGIPVLGWEDLRAGSNQGHIYAQRVWACA